MRSPVSPAGLLGCMLILTAAAELPAQQIPVRFSDDQLNFNPTPEVRAAARKQTLSSRLASIASASEMRGVDWKGSISLKGLLLDGPDEIRIEARVDPSKAAAVAEAMRESGGRVRYQNAPGLIEATLPVSALKKIAEVEGIRTVMPARIPDSQIGASTSQGVALSNVLTAFGAGIDGSGVTVAVVDNFNNTAATLQASGDWPAGITTVDVDGGGFGDNMSLHGMATLEIAYDVAPGASFRAYEIGSVGDWYNAILQASTDGADVISSSLGAPLDGIGDGSAMPGSIAEAADLASGMGTLYVNAAGNHRLDHWGGLYADFAPVPGSHDWGGGNVNPAVFCQPEGAFIRGILFWDDWTVVDHDYDLYLLEYDPNITDWIARDASIFFQTGVPGQTPQEILTYVADTTLAGLGCPVGTGAFGFYVDRFSAATNRNLQVFSTFDLAVFVPERSLGFPGDSPSVMTVGAIGAGSLTQESYSSEGPILAPGGGIPVNPTLGMKPDVMSFSGVDTESYGLGVFGGTSASAPHVAGIAALVLQKDPTLSVDSLMARIRAWAAKNDLGTAGFDNQTGYGKAAFHPDTLLFGGAAILEGAYVGFPMQTSALFKSSLPSTQPYGDPVFDGTALEFDEPISVSSFPPSVVDWIKVELRSDPTTVVQEQVGFLLEDRSVVDTAGGSLSFPCVSPDSFYVVVHHRNHQSVMSSEKVDFSSGLGEWSFTGTLSNLYTLGPDPVKDVGGGGPYGMFAGNAVPDKQTLANDFNAWLIATKSALTGYLLADFNLDGQVTATDFNFWLENTKAAAASQVP